MTSSYNSFKQNVFLLLRSKYLASSLLLTTILAFLLAWAFENEPQVRFSILLLSTVLVVPASILLSAWIIRSQPASEALGPTDELNKEIAAAKKNRFVLLIMTVAIGGYVAFQAVKVIQIADEGGVESSYITTLRTQVEWNQINLSRIQGLIDTSVTTEDKQKYFTLLNNAQGELATATDQYMSELRDIENERRLVDGKFFFDFFSSFFARVASVGITLTFFAVSLTQYRKVDLRILELSQLKLAHVLAATEIDPSLLESYRRIVAILDMPTKSLPDDTEVTIPREAFTNILGVIDKIGLSNLINKGNEDSKT